MANRIGRKLGCLRPSSPLRRNFLFTKNDSKIKQRENEMKWVGRIYRALKENRFCLYTQAIESTSEHDEKHFELLIRMKDDEGGIIPPGAFLPAAERYYIATKIDRWVVKEATRLFFKYPSFLESVGFVSINLSGQTLTDDSFLSFIIDSFCELGVDAGKICIEITETAAISSLSSAIKFISTLKGIGFKFALDDFGSGLSSFGYLKNLPVDYLKIDGQFVKGMTDDPIDRAMVKSINEVGQIMGMKTIAEFVENDETRDMLSELGVNYVQGYGIAKPQPLLGLLQDEFDNYC